MTTMFQLFLINTDYSFLHCVESTHLLPMLDKIMIEEKLDLKNSVTHFRRGRQESTLPLKRIQGETQKKGKQAIKPK